MKRLSLEELKAQKADQVTQNLEEIKGGDVVGCHCKEEATKAAAYAGTHGGNAAATFWITWCACQIF